MGRKTNPLGERSKKASKVIIDGQKTQVRLTTKTTSKRHQELAKKLLERSAQFDPRFVAELKKMAAGEPYVMTIDVIYKQRK